MGRIAKQNEQVLRRLQMSDIVTQVNCYCMEPAILRLASVIERLKKQGHEIVTIKVKRRDGLDSPTCGYILRQFFRKRLHREFFND